jgi:hypothetical protein
MGRTPLPEADLSQSERVILSILNEESRCMTTKEVRELAKKRLVQCPDSTAAFLSRLRMKKRVSSIFSKERGGWIWWAENS